MRQAATIITIETRRRGFVEITLPVERWVADQAIETGLLTLFCRHTSASLTIQENASPDVRSDIEAFFDRVAPEAEGLYAHDEEGADDMPAHIRTMLTGVDLSIPVVEGRPVLGTWQGIFLVEHRRRPHRRQIALHLLGA